MKIRTQLRHSVQVARAERMRRQRNLDHSTVFRAVVAVVLVGIAIGGAVSAYTVGVAVRHGQVVIPLETVRGATMAVFLGFLAGAIPRTSRLRERIETDHLLTTVSASEVVLGMALAVAGQLATPVASVAVGVAVGFALGFGSLAAAVSLVVAVAGLFALAVVFGVGVSFLIELVTTRSPRFRKYKSALIVVAFFALALGYAILAGGTVSIESLFGGVGVAPPAWFADLGLLGVPAAHANLLRGAGAIGTSVIGAPLLLMVATALATRVWETEPVSAAVLHRSRALVGSGLAERLLAGHVSRPVLTVARKRWLQERRAPQSLLMVGYLPLLVFVLFPVLVAGGVLLAPILFAFLLAAGTGFAFGMNPIPTEYSSLQMTLTTITGEQFVRGTILSGVAIGTPVTTLVTLLLAVRADAPLGSLDTVALGFVGAVLSVCSVTVAAAIGMRVSYHKLVPVPVPLTNISMYAEIGRMGFVRMGYLLGLLGIVCLPAVLGYLPIVFEPGAAILGVPSVVVRVSSLGLTAILAVGVMMSGYRRTVRLYDHYTLA